MKILARIQSHTALRGIAALLVVGYHLQFGVSYRLPWETATPFLERSYLFVDLFFVLSGFIISYVSGVDEPLQRTRLLPFLSARFARLYPLHAFCLLYFVLFTLASQEALRVAGHATGPSIDAHSWLSLVSQFVLINAWYPRDPHWNVATWSISAEFTAYALFPLLARLRSANPRTGDTVLLLVPGAFLLAILATTGNLDIIQGLAPLRCLSGFLIGMMLFYHRHSVERLSSVTISAIQFGAALAILALLATASPDPLIIPPFALLVWATWTDRGVIPWLLDRKGFVRLGDWSYSIYLNHIPMMYMTSFFWMRAGNHLPLTDAAMRTIYIVITYGTVVGGSALTFRYVEVPARHWLSRHMLRKHQSTRIAAPGAP